MTETKTYISKERPHFVARYVQNKIEHHHNTQLGFDELEDGGVRLRKSDSKALIEFQDPKESVFDKPNGTYEIQVRGKGKILSWTKHMLSKPSSPTGL